MFSPFTTHPPHFLESQQLSYVRYTNMSSSSQKIQVLILNILLEFSTSCFIKYILTKNYISQFFFWESISKIIARLIISKFFSDNSLSKYVYTFSTLIKIFYQFIFKNRKPTKKRLHSYHILSLKKKKIFTSSNSATNTLSMAIPTKFV